MCKILTVIKKRGTLVGIIENHFFGIQRMSVLNLCSFVKR